MKSYPIRAVAGALLALLLGACGSTASAPVESDHDRQFNFAAVRAIYIEPFSRTDAATITVSDGQVRRIDAAITAELQRKGYEVVADGAKADLYLSWYLILKDEVHAAPGACPGCDRPASSDSERYAKGTLIVDMIDPVRGQPVWRSRLHTRLTAEPDSPGAEQARQEAAAAIFADFPPT